MSKGVLANRKVVLDLQATDNGAGLALARDHVAQAYLGQWGGDALVEKLRNRIHWITSQVRGKRVLDVGTSEGIVPILLGREGFRVVGIDINAEAIEYANSLLAEEGEAVRGRVEFRNISLFQEESELSFDTVVMGEVLEHVSNAENFVARAMHQLANNGTLIITTPFGVFPGSAPKHIFYLSDICELLARRVRIEHLLVEDGYIRVVARKVSGKSEHAPAKTNDVVGRDALLALTEDATYSSQAVLWRQLDRARKEVENLRNDLKNKTEALRQSENERQQDRQRVVSAEAAVAAKDEAIEHLRAAMEALTTENQICIEQLTDRLAAAEERSEALQQELATERHQRSQAEERNEALQQKFAAERDRLVADRAEAVEKVRTEQQSAAEQRLDQLIQQTELQAKEHASQIAELERRALAAKQTISFRLGQGLMAGLKSPREFIRLPGLLWDLNQEARARRKAARNVASAPAVPQCPKENGMGKGAGSTIEPNPTAGS